MDSELKIPADLQVRPGTPDAVWLPAHEVAEIATLPVSLERHPDVSPEQHARALRRLRRVEEEETSRSEEGARELERLGTEHVGALRDLVGGDAWERIQEFRRSRRDQRARLQLDLRLADALTSEKRMQEWRRETRTQWEELSKKLKIDRRTVQEIHRKSRARFEALGTGTGTGDAFQVAEVLRNDEVPDEIRTFRTNPWSVRRPPYPGESYATSQRALGGFAIEREEVSVNPRSTLFENVISVYDLRASDFDTAWITQRSRAGFGYFTFLRDGHLEIYFKAISLGGVRHHHRFEDEWGLSSFSAEQELSFILSVVAPIADVGFAQSTRLSHFRVDLDINESVIGGPVDRTDFEPLHIYWFHLITTEPWPANQPLQISFGFNTQVKHFSNDYSVYGSLRSHWALVGAQLRLVGG